MKKLFTFLIVGLFSHAAIAQQFGLYNTNTLFDGFENPSQKTFQADSSRKNAFNFLIPTITFNSAFTGEAQSSFKDLVFRRLINADLPIGEGKANKLMVNSNNYILMFRSHRNIYWNREIGFSWQIRQQGRIRATNETLVLLADVNRFATPDDLSHPGIFDNEGYNQLYHQFSLTYREDLDKNTGLGVKLSALSGVLYNKLDINRSSIGFADNTYVLDLKGSYRSNIGFNELDLTNDGMPGFRNPGASLSLGISHRKPGGWFLIGNLKDLGVIRWNRSSFLYSFDGALPVAGTNTERGRETLVRDVKDFFSLYTTQESFFAPTDAKAEVLIGRQLDWYRPNLVISKSLFYPGGNIALVNHFAVKNFIFSAQGDYNLNNYLQLGGQAMYKTPNVEMFIGSDQLLKTYHSAKNILLNSSENGSGYTGASIYLGVGFKFGRVLEHPMNAGSIPGVTNISQENQGILKRLTSKLKRKRGQ